MRILGIVASPRDLAPLDVDGERKRDRAGAGARRRRRAGAPRLARAGLAAQPAAGPSRRQLPRHPLRRAQRLHGGRQRRHLPRGPRRPATPVEVDETLFANLLSDQNLLRLVVLNSCEGARTTLTDPYAGVATTLVQLGVPAVVAMQFEISDRAAIVFAEELYTNLIGRRDPIDASVAEARKAIYSDVDKVEWATPVLFVRDPDVELFRFGRDARPSTDGVDRTRRHAASRCVAPPRRRRCRPWRRPTPVIAARRRVVVAALIAVWWCWLRVAARRAVRRRARAPRRTSTTARRRVVQLGFPHGPRRRRRARSSSRCSTCSPSRTTRCR